jgi:mannose-6-phosphate isomerase-like protein (cupin superfamily)
MKLVMPALTLILTLSTWPVLAHDKEHEEVERKGYVLKRGEGEKLGPGRVIKASPQSGTQGGVMVLDQAPANFTVGLHYHTEADEFFYILAGQGSFNVHGEDIPIGPGDVVFVPAGTDHGFSVSAERPLDMLVFLDRPGLAQDFRELHALRRSNPGPLTLEQRNAIARKYGTVYRELSSFEDAQ